MSRNIEEIIKEIAPKIDEFRKNVRMYALCDTERKHYLAKVHKAFEEIKLRLDGIGNDEFASEVRAAVQDTLSDREELKVEPLPFRLQHLEREIVDIKDFKLEVLFDFPQPLQIHVTYTGCTPRVINIIDSILEDVTNLGHPLIIKAIERYRQHASTSLSKGRSPRGSGESASIWSEVANDCLRKIADALRYPKPVKTPGVPVERFLERFELYPYNLDYFDAVSAALRSPGFLNNRTATNKIMQFRIQLSRQIPHLDHSRACEWLCEKDSETQRR